MACKSGKRTRLTLQEKFGGVENVAKRQFAVRYHVQVLAFSSRFVTKLKSEGAALLAEAEKNGRSLQSKSLRRGQ